MKVSWSKNAGNAVVRTSVYIMDKFGLKASEDFLEEVQHVSDLLEGNPYLGPVEPLLAQKVKTIQEHCPEPSEQNSLLR